MDIGIIGAGKIGGTLGWLLVDAGHRVRFGVRDAAALSALLEELGPGAAAGSAMEAAAFGEAVIFAAPFGAWPGFAAGNADALAGKVVIDAANPYPERDGPMADAAVESGEGSATYFAGLLSRAHVAKAFNTIYWSDLRDRTGHEGGRLAMPIAGDAPCAIALAERLATDTGFDPVVVGPLARSASLDPGSAIYGRSLTAIEVRKALGPQD